MRRGEREEDREKDEPPRKGEANQPTATTTLSSWRGFVGSKRRTDGREHDRTHCFSHHHCCKKCAVPRSVRFCRRKRRDLAFIPVSQNLNVESNPTEKISVEEESITSSPHPHHTERGCGCSHKEMLRGKKRCIAVTLPSRSSCFPSTGTSRRHD